MHHHGHNHNHVEELTSLKAGYYIAIALNLAYVIYEIVSGLSSNSMGLLSDAGHKFIDTFWLILSLVAFRLAASKPTSGYTYGYRKASVLIALINAVVLFVAITMIIEESAVKFAHPEEVDGIAMSWTAGIGILVGALSALVLMRYRKHDINTRGAFLHMASDAFVSIGVLASGIVIHFTGWYVLDSIVSIVIAGVILASTVKLLKDSFAMIVDAVPPGFNIYDAGKVIESVANVEKVEDIHIRAISITQTALTARVCFKDITESVATIGQIKKSLSDMNITEAVIEPFSEN